MYKEIYKTIDQYEGKLSDDPNDPGGLTNYGISAKEYPAVDIRNLTRDGAYAIYEKDFWNVLRCGELHSMRVRWKLFDIGVNIGVGDAARMLQRVIHVEEDGIVGSQTVAAVNRIIQSSVGEKMVLWGLTQEKILHDVRHVQKEPSQLEYLFGWALRAFDQGTDLF